MAARKTPARTLEDIVFSEVLANSAPFASPLLPRPNYALAIAARMASTQLILLEKLERAKGFEPSTPTLARLCSTPELRPH